MKLKIGVDVGGTFIDLVVSGDKLGTRFHKTLADPKDLAGSLLAGLEFMAKDLGLTLAGLLEQTLMIIHGSTVATNALLTRTGAKTALLTTEGFRDVLNMRRGMRSNQYDPKQAPPMPLVPRQLIFPIPERIDCEGNVVKPINKKECDEILTKLRDEGVESVAIGFLFSFMNKRHEDYLASRLKEFMPEAHISTSNEVLPEVRFYERLSTTVVNAYVTPVLSRYLRALELRLKNTGFKGDLLIMQSNGGVMGLEASSKYGVRSILSGPASGPIAGAWYANLQGLSNAITMDMGGTSFDVCLINRGKTEVTKEIEIAGQRIALPLVAVHTIGAGGGSIVKRDSRGLLQVGPESAGSTPGPVCYGRGGIHPTVTDADVLVGYLGTKSFWGGRLHLDKAAAFTAFHKEIALPMDMEVVEAAYGAYQVVNAAMVDAIREVSIRRGFDPRDFVLVAAGGAGPIHACEIAKELDVPLILIPREASVMCAIGQLLSDLRHDYVRSYVLPLDKIDCSIVKTHYSGMETQALEVLISEGIKKEKIFISYSADVRYVGQFNDVEVPVKSPHFSERSLVTLVNAFHKLHESLNGYHIIDAAVELVNLRLVAKGQTTKPRINNKTGQSSGKKPKAILHRKAYFSTGFIDVPVFDGLDFMSGINVPGPAIVELETTTIIVQPGYELNCDPYGNFLLHKEGLNKEKIVNSLKSSGLQQD